MIDNNHSYWDTACSECGELFTKHGVTVHKTRKHMKTTRTDLIETQIYALLTCAADIGASLAAVYHYDHAEFVKDVGYPKLRAGMDDLLRRVRKQAYEEGYTEALKADNLMPTVHNHIGDASKKAYKAALQEALAAIKQVEEKHFPYGDDAPAHEIVKKIQALLEEANETKD